MKVSYRWLSDYVDLTGNTAAELAEKITRSGIEVDEVEKRNKGVEKVVVGYVKSKEKHPDADKLNVCLVDAGLGEDLQIVCGAKNVAAGQKVPVALVGAKLPDGLQIKRAKLRGVESQGMICSAKELGLNDKLLPKEIQEGILVLPENTEIGGSILELLAIDDEVMELDLTPNRSDCLSMLGSAYEVAAILGGGVTLPNPLDGLEESAEPVRDTLSISISAPEQCSHYSARIIDGVTVAPSPLWIQNRLMAAGVRPINNIVDITNYVMLEYGQPLHAFDAAKLDGGRIDVRLAREGERIVTLDDADRALEPHMLLVTDGVKPIAIAGVMGGANSEVTAETTRIVLESAKFSGSSVRRTSRQLGLRSEASLRFEKEVNPEAVIDALNRAAGLICRYAGGKAAAGIAEAATDSGAAARVKLSLEKVNGYLGTELTLHAVTEILDRLHFDYAAVEGETDTLLVSVPRRRGDITLGVDLIEEIARLYGYDRIPTTLMTGVTTPGSLNKEQKIRRTLRSLLTGSGLHEVITYTFTHPDQIRGFAGSYPEAKPIGLAMPMSEERSFLRTSLIPHLLEIAQYNRNRNNDDIAVFELGKIFITNEDVLTRQPVEKWMLSLLLTGSRNPLHWSSKPQKFDFFDAKGVVEKLTDALGISDVRYTPVKPEGFHPGRTAEISVKGEVLGRIGQLHPDIQREKDLDDTYLVEIELDQLCALADFTIEYRQLPRYPAVSRDIAIVVADDVPVGNLQETVKQTAGELLESVYVFDIFTGERLGAGRKSVALSLVYRNQERTLTDEEVTEAHGKVVAALEQTFAAELRK